MELAQKRVLITGASRGIGEALAHAFAGAGATVALVARTEGLLRTLAVELGGSAHIADLSDPGQVATLIDRVEDEVGPIDVLVNNAGIDNSTGGFADAPDDDLRKVTQVNYLAPAELCRRAIPRMLRRGAGHIVNVSSMGGLRCPSGVGVLLGFQSGSFTFHRGPKSRPSRLADPHHPRRTRADPHRPAGPYRGLPADR